jgi:hypothetical protein
MSNKRVDPRWMAIGVFLLLPAIQAVNALIGKGSWYSVLSSLVFGLFIVLALILRRLVEHLNRPDLKSLIFGLFFGGAAWAYAARWAAAPDQWKFLQEHIYDSIGAAALVGVVAYLFVDGRRSDRGWRRPAFVRTVALAGTMALVALLTDVSARASFQQQNFYWPLVNVPLAGLAVGVWLASAQDKREPNPSQDSSAIRIGRLARVLAVSANHRADRLWELGHRKEALDAMKEAVGLYRHAAEAQPAAFRIDLWRSLRTYCVWLGELGDREKAQDVCLEASILLLELRQEGLV